MRKFFILLDKLSEQGTWYTLQSGSGAKYYNFSVMTPKERKETYHGHSLEEMTDWLYMRWGHLLDKPLPSIPALPALPTLG